MSKNEIQNCSKEAEYWIKGFLTGNEPEPPVGDEEAEPNVMNRPPYKPQEGIFARGLGWQIVGMGLLIGLLSVGTGFWLWKGESGS